MPANLQNKLKLLLRVPRLTRRRMMCAMAIAVVADGAQLLLGPFGWVFLVQAIDVIAAVLVSCTLGFHWLLLPSFVVELIPIVDMLPTWTACVAAVIVLRKKERRAAIDV